MSVFAPSRAGYPHRNLHGQIVHAIGRQILRGELRPGDPIPLPHDLPASRTALREAIKVLAAKGLVEARPKTGTRVRARDAWNLLDPDVLAWRQDGMPPLRFVRSVTELRSIIEPGAAALAAARASASDIAAIERAFHDMEAAVPLHGPMDVSAFVEADTRFHTAILQAAGNDILEQLAHVVAVALRASFEVTSRIPGSARATLPRHRAVLEAIRTGRPQPAAGTMRALVKSIDRMVEDLPDTTAPDTREPQPVASASRHRSRSPGRSRKSTGQRPRARARTPRR
jgi:DNA-binding FadR family transcriptional regulator